MKNTVENYTKETIIKDAEYKSDSELRRTQIKQRVMNCKKIDEKENKRYKERE